MKFFLKRRILTGRLNKFIVFKLNLIDLEKFFNVSQRRINAPYDICLT